MQRPIPITKYFRERQGSPISPDIAGLYSRLARQHATGWTTPSHGITYPALDDLLERTDSKYSLVIYSAKRARQINAYYSQLSVGLLEYVGPLVETQVHEKPLSVALREINSHLLTSTPLEA